MKYLVLVVTLLVVAGCSTSPSKLERIEALEAENAVQQTQIQKNMQNINENRMGVRDNQIRIDRMFEKAMLK